MLGDLSKKYESLGDPASINRTNGPHCEASYGAYQFYAGDGVVQAFVKWLCTSVIVEYAVMGKQLSQDTPPSIAFNNIWIQVAKDNSDVFLQSQYDYCKIMYYDVAVSQLIKAGIDVTKHSNVLQDVVWSCAVQYGPFKIPALFSDAEDYMRTANMDITEDSLLIPYIYFTRGTATWRKDNCRLIWRMMSECSDAIEDLVAEKV